MALRAFDGNIFILYLMENVHKSSPSRRGPPLLTFKELPSWNMFAPLTVFKSFVTCWLCFHDLYKYSCWVVKIVRYEPMIFIKDKPSVAVKNNSQMKFLAWEILNFLIGRRRSVPDTGWLCSCLVLTYLPERPWLPNGCSFSLLWKQRNTRKGHRAKPVSALQNPPGQSLHWELTRD